MPSGGAIAKLAPLPFLTEPRPLDASTSNLDWLLGLLALAIAVGGLLMLASGVRSMNDDEP
jgi:hypothetical protein